MSAPHARRGLLDDDDEDDDDDNDGGGGSGATRAAQQPPPGHVYVDDIQLADSASGYAAHNMTRLLLYPRTDREGRIAQMTHAQLVRRVCDLEDTEARLRTQLQEATHALRDAHVDAAAASAGAERPTRRDRAHAQLAVDGYRVPTRSGEGVMFPPISLAAHPGGLRRPAHSAFPFQVGVVLGDERDPFPTIGHGGLSQREAFELFQTINTPARAMHTALGTVSGQNMHTDADIARIDARRAEEQRIADAEYEQLLAAE